MSRLPSVYLDVVPVHIRQRMTDWRYVRFMLPRLVEWLPGLQMHLQKSSKVSVRANSKYMLQVVGQRLAHIHVAPRVAFRDELDERELERSGCEVVFSHRGYPQNAGSVPVIWQNSILDPHMTMSYLQCDAAALQAEIEEKQISFGRAAVVQVSTEAERERLSRMFPALRSRFISAGFFAPFLTLCPAAALEKHVSPRKVQILFVGNEARRKGLDYLLTAYSQLPSIVRRRTQLTIISTFDDGAVALPSDGSIRVMKGADHTTVLSHMRAAHLLVNPARFESFGLVFLEAMALGAVAVGPCWEVQRELLDDGRAGVLVQPGASDLQSKLRWLIDDDAARLGIAERAHARFGERYAPAVVANEIAGVLRSAAGSGIGRVW